MKNEHFELSPMQDYSTPEYPTRATSHAGTLRKLPARWMKNAAVIACLSAMSISTLTGCIVQDRDILHGGGEAQMPYYVNSLTEQDVSNRETRRNRRENRTVWETYPPARCDDGLHGENQYIENNFELDIRLSSHGGGAASEPFYVAYLTEQEVFGIIRNRLCEAGICFSSPVPDYSVSIELETYWETQSTITATLSLFDERTRQGIVFPTPWRDWFSEDFGVSRNELEMKLNQEFQEQFGITVTFIQRRSEFVGHYDWEDEAVPTLTDDEEEEVRRYLNGRILTQVDALIDHLRAEGILS